MPRYRISYPEQSLSQKHSDDAGYFLFTLIVFITSQSLLIPGVPSLSQFMRACRTWGAGKQFRVLAWVVLGAFAPSPARVNFLFSDPHC